MFSLESWNINPNKSWFVRLADGGANIAVGLYLSRDEAEAQTNRQAHGVTSGFGSALPVTLAMDAGSTIPISLFQELHTWHLKVSGQDGDSIKIYKIKEFVDLDEVSHPIYRNSCLITSRATAEIDSHTHARILKEVELGSHLPELEPGRVVRLDSSRRGKDNLLQTLEHRIAGEISEDREAKLTSSVTVANYLTLRR